MNRRPRTEFTKATKVKAHERSKDEDGIPRCEAVWDGVRCNRQLFPGKFVFDHKDADYWSRDASLENCQVICDLCDRIKTPEDQKQIAKLRRIEEKHLGIKKPKGWNRTLNGRPITRDIQTGQVIYKDTREPVR